MQVCILGATGSIGLNTLDVIRQHADDYAVFAISAHRNIEKLFELCVEFQPRYAVLVESANAQEFQGRLKAAESKTELLVGESALCDVAAHAEVDIVMAAIVGAAGLSPNLAAARAGKKVLLANKESLVMSGNLFIDAINASGAQLLPIDSEHNAIYQCLPHGYKCGDSLGREVRRLLLTASGGPFRTFDKAMLDAVTPQQACAHIRNLFFS